MKKILIISYFFPPCNLTAAQRAGGWAKYLSQFGYAPVVVTRNWEHPINATEDVLLSSGKEVIHELKDGYEVYYLPYEASKRDKIYAKNKHKKHVQKLSKIYTLRDLFLENFTNKSIPFSNIYDFAKQLLEKDSTFEALIISGNPFIQFKFGFDLQQKFGIKWIADYRDGWNTNELEANKKDLMSYVTKFQIRSEKKWVGTAECVTSISPFYAKRTGEFVNKPYNVILNGYDGLETVSSTIEKDKFLITYNGSLYPTQPIEDILDAVKKLLDDNEITIDIQLHFPGLGFDKGQKKRVQQCLEGYLEKVFITDRVPKDDVLRIQQRSDVLLMITHSNFKGIPSSKMYEYIGLQKQILLYPNDKDIVEETLFDSGLGIVCETAPQIYEKLKELVIAKQNGGTVGLELDTSKISFYSRKHQTAELAKLLDQITGVEKD